VNSGDLITLVICTSGAGGIVPLLDTFIGADSGNPPDRVTASLESDRYYRWCVYLFVPLQFASLRERRRCRLPLASAAQSLASAASAPPPWGIFEYTSAQPLGPALYMPENGILVEIFSIGADLLEQRPLAFNRGMTE